MSLGYYGQSKDTHPHGGTPDYIIENIKKQYGEMFDPCPNNPTFDGLAIAWPLDKVCFVNPPYTRGQIGKWVKKCSDEQSRYGRTAPIILLIPSYTDTVYFHTYIYDAYKVSIEFIKGRLKFKGYEQKASFPSMLVMFEGFGCDDE